jgi:phage FluMu protein Com
MISKKIRCSGCGHESTREIAGTVSHKSAADVFTDYGHDPYSGKLYLRCPRCKVVVAVSPIEVLESKPLSGPRNILKSEVAILVKKQCPLPVWGGFYSVLTLFSLIIKHFN